MLAQQGLDRSTVGPILTTAECPGGQGQQNLKGVQKPKVKSDLLPIRLKVSDQLYSKKTEQCWQPNEPH